PRLCWGFTPREIDKIAVGQLQPLPVRGEFHLATKQTRQHGLQMTIAKAAHRGEFSTAAEFIGIGRRYLRHQLLWPSSNICSSCSWASSHAISHSSRPDLALACCCRQAVNSALRLWRSEERRVGKEGVSQLYMEIYYLFIIYCG